MYFLFHALLHFKGKRHALLGTASLIIYINHPMMIVVVRLFAKLLHLQSLLIENNMIHYLAVCVMSAVFAVMICFLRILLHKRSHSKFHAQ